MRISSGPQMVRVATRVALSWNILFTVAGSPCSS